MDSRQPPPTMADMLARELLVSEHLRITVMAGLDVLLLITFLAVLTFAPGYRQAIFLGIWRAGIALGVGGLGIVYGFAWRRRLTKHLQRNTYPIPLMKYLTVLFETSLPTLVLLVQTKSEALEVLLELPVTLTYFLFIALSTLSLSFRVCLFAGLVAGLEYLSVTLLVVDPRLRQSAIPILSPYGSQIHMVVFMILASLLAGLVAVRLRQTLVRCLETMEARRRVVDIFGKHVSPQVVERLLTEDIELGGETRHVCVMFLDIRDFTRFAGGRNPEAVVRYLNELFEFMIGSVTRHQGIVNKFLGDGFMAVFGAPLSDGRESAHAVAAAREILQRLDRLNQSRPGPPTRIGIGLHAGPSVAGTVGSFERKEYTIIGDTVNLASRIEALNKQYHSRLLISGGVWNELGEGRPEAICLGPVQLRGKEESVEVYRLD